MRKIFINYRRAEAEYAAGALGRELRRHFGDDRIFRDKEDIGGGASWKRRVLDEINGESALLILIGRDWATVTDAQGRRRLDNPDDPLRMEIADGLRDGAAILPILLENAEMPADTELPADLRSITEHNALRLRDGDWQYDLDNICRTLEKAGFEPISSPRQTKTAPSSPTAAATVKVILSAVLIVLVYAALGADDLDREGHIGAAIMSFVALTLGILTWRENRHGSAKARVFGIVVSALAGLRVLAGVGGIDSAPGTSRVVQPAAVQAKDIPATVVPAAAPRVASDPRREPLRRAIADRPTNQPDNAPAVVATGSGTVATTASDTEGGSLREIVLGAWRYEVDQAIEGGRFRGAFTDQFLRNGASTSVGRASIITRLPDGTPFEMTWQCNATAEWSLDGRHLTERLIDLKSFVTDVKINTQSVDVATFQRNLQGMGQSLPTLESLLPRGLSTESQIVAANPTEMTLRAPDETGGFRTTVYRKVGATR